MESDFSNRPPGALSPTEMLSRVRGRGARLRRRRRMATGGLLTAVVGALAGLVLTVAPGPSPRQVAVLPPLSVTPAAGGGGSCPVSPFVVGTRPAVPLPPTSALTTGAYRNLGLGQTVTLFASTGGSITLTRGVGLTSFAVSVWSAGRPLTPVDVLGAPGLLYPAGKGTPGARIPFRYPGPASQTDPCRRYQLQAVGVADRILVAVAEGLQARTPTAPADVPSTTTVPAPQHTGPPGAGPEPCQAASLHVAGGRQGENGGAHGDIVVTNTGVAACTLVGPPTVEILNAGGDPLLTWPLSNTLPTTVFMLEPAQSASAAVYWANWCQANPGPLEVAIHLATGTATGPFDGPPDYDYVPGCSNPTGSSTLQVVQSWQMQAG